MDQHLEDPEMEGLWRKIGMATEQVGTITVVNCVAGHPSNGETCVFSLGLFHKS